LLDTNVLIAWSWPHHLHHANAREWFALEVLEKIWMCVAIIFASRSARGSATAEQRHRESIAEVLSSMRAKKNCADSICRMTLAGALSPSLRSRPTQQTFALAVVVPDTCPFWNSSKPTHDVHMSWRTP
jgi:predicted nucleic acid-binding protein